MRIAVAVAVLVFGSAALGGQNAGQNQGQGAGQGRMEGLSADGQRAQTTVLVLPESGVGCPVGMRAQHGAGGAMVQADKSRPKGAAQLLHLSLTNRDEREIVAARVRVHGLSGKARVAASRTSGDDADRVEELEVRFAAGSGRQVSGDVWAAGMTAVLSIDLLSVSYEDGLRRSFAERDGCRVVPDPLMWIAGR